MRLADSGAARANEVGPDERTFSLPRAARNALSQLALRIGVEPAAVLAAAFGTLLHRHTGDASVAFAHVFTPDGATARRATLVQLQFEEGTPFDAAVRQAAEQQRRSIPSPELEDGVADRFRTTLDDERADAAWRSSARLPQDAADRLGERLALLLSSARANPACAVGALALITDAERRQQAAWNATTAPYDRETSLVAAMLRRCAAAPNDEAVRSGDVRLTYGELERRSAQLACALRAHGAAPGTFVAIYLERTVEMYVAILGIQRAGAAYVPIDPAYPPDRVAYMLSNCGALAVLTQRSLAGRLHDPAVAALVLDDDGAATFAGDERPPALPGDPHRLAYAIYTSGSTGRPKGVLIEQHSVQNLLAGLAAHVAMGPGDTLIALAPLAFDMSVVDVYLPLTTGARIVVASRETATNPRALAALMDASRVTHMQATPSTWRTLIETGWNGTRGLVVMTGGEALPQSVSDGLVERAETVWNLYGPTEATVWATMHRIARVGEPVTIGTPMVNVSAHVLDPARGLLPPNFVGELFVGGAGVARGYLARPELTAERFVTDPFRAPEPARMYATGDLARYRADGCIEFLGRSDFQVKVRGFRIELGEVEAALVAQPGIRAAVAAVREDTPGDPHLIGYVAVGEHADVAAGPLRRALLATLPAYMVPDTIVILDALPLSANGKVDRKALPVPAATVSDEATRVAPRTITEMRLLAIWEDALDVHPIGVTDDFFDIGATSITAARVFDRIEREMGAALPLSPLFQAPTIERLAELIDGGVAERRWTSLVPIQPHGSETPVFCVHGGAGTIIHFRPLARRLGSGRPFYGLQMQGLYGDAPVHRDVGAMAEHYLREIKTVRPHGPYVIGGYCFGAIVAFEIVRRLEREGETVELLFSINGPTPHYIRTFGGPSKAAPPRPPANLWDRTAGRLWKRVQWERAEGLQMRLLEWRLRRMAAKRAPLPDAWRREAIYHICMEAEVRYEPLSTASRTVVFAAPALYRVADLGWERHCTGAFEVCAVPGDHRNQRTAMAEPHAGFIADRLRAVLAAAEAGS